VERARVADRAEHGVGWPGGIPIAEIRVNQCEVETGETHEEPMGTYV
jgi:hypothetical protein